MQDCQSQCKHREKVDSSFSSSSCSLPLTKHEIVPWVSLCLFQKIPVQCSHHVCSNLCVCTELGKWLIGSHQSSQVIEIRGEKGKTTKALSVCTSDGTVVGDALGQAGQRQCWVTRVFLMKPGLLCSEELLRRRALLWLTAHPHSHSSLGTKPC